MKPLDVILPKISVMSHEMITRSTAPAWIGLFLCLILFPVTSTADPVPTFTITGGSGTFTILGLAFDYTGVNVEIRGEVESSPGPCLGLICGHAGDQISPNTPIIGTNVGTFAVANGTSYPDLEFNGDVNISGAPLTIPDTTNPILSEPVTFTNDPFLSACVPPFFCPGPDEVFRVTFPSSGQATLYLTGPLTGPGVAGLYVLDHATYSVTTPESGTLLLVGCGILGLALEIRRTRNCGSPHHLA